MNILRLFLIPGLILMFNGCITNAYPDLQTPEDGNKTFLPFLHFTWSEHPDAFTHTGAPVYYEIQIASDKKFDKIVDTDTIYLNRYVNDKPLKPGTYYWRVRSVPIASRTTGWTKTNSFSVTPCDETVYVKYDPESPDHYDVIQEALQSSLSIIRAGKSVQLVFPEGEYRFDKPDTPLIRILEASNLLIDGGGSMVLPARYRSSLIVLEKCQNIAVMNFTVDYPVELPFTQGTIIGVDRENSTAKIRFSEGYPEFDAPQVIRSGHWHALLDQGTTGRLKTGAVSHMYFTDHKKNADGSWTAGVGKRHLDSYAAGDRFVLVCRKPGASLASSNGCENITFYNITSFASSGGHFVSIGGSNLNILHCGTRIGEGRWYSGNADGIHVREHIVGPWIEGCDFRGIGDDAIALYARPATIAKVSGDDQNLCFMNREFFNLEPGNEVSFFNPKEGIIIMECKVESIDEGTDNTYQVRFTGKIPQEIITGPGSQLLEITQVWNRDKSCGNFMIRNNSFDNIRRFGTVFRAKRGVVEKNKYNGCSSSAIIFENEPNWPNGLYASDIIIRKNMISDCSFQGGIRQEAPICIRFQRHWVNPAKDIGPRGFFIEGNMISECPTPQIEIVSARDIVMRDNFVKKDDVLITPEVYTENTENVKP